MFARGEAVFMFQLTRLREARQADVAAVHPRGMFQLTRLREARLRHAQRLLRTFCFN